MDLPETLESINKQLIDLFGVDTVTGKPMFRVVESWTQFEKRLTNMTKDGFQLLTPEVVELPKYNQNDLDYRGMYILERLVIVPLHHLNELPTSGQSYEPLWVFRDKEYKPLPPVVWACKFVIDTMYAALGKSSLAKYVDEEAKNPIEAREKRIAEYTEILFGDESNLLGRTITGEAVGYTGAPKDNTSQTDGEK